MKLKASPPKPQANDRDERIATFVTGATANPVTREPEARQARPMPWREPHVRSDVTVQVNARLPEPLALKLGYVSKMTDAQKQDLIAEGVEMVLNARLRSLGYGDDDL